MKRLLITLAAAVGAAFLVAHFVFERDPNYLHADEFLLEMGSSHRPTDSTMGVTLRFERIEPCIGADIEDRGMEIDLRLVREGAPRVQPDAPLVQTEKGPTISFEHPRVAQKGSPVTYTLYGPGDTVAHRWTVTPTID